MSNNDGGPAFPTGKNPRVQVRAGGRLESLGHPGMTLRDWFAGMALANHIICDSDNPGEYAERNSCYAYQVADAMLAEREKGK